MPRLRHVAVLIETTRGYSRGLIEGIARYSREHGPWSMYFEPHDLGAPPPRWLKRWKGNGILVRLNDLRMLRTIRATRLPAVDVRGLLEPAPLPMVGLDNVRVMQLAAEHLRGQGLRHFAFCGVPGGPNPTLDLRRNTFIGLVEQFGARCEVFEVSGNELQSSPNWERDLDRMAQWLRRLPKPVGIAASDDQRGFQILDACRRAGITVPEEVAVVGINNDLVLCHLAYPPLSSVDPGPIRIGYEAAACLDRMMRGKPPPRQPIFLEPQELVVRQSSDVIAIDDRVLAEALRYIRMHAGEQIGVKDILRAVPISRSVLERKFRQNLGRTPKDEIMRIRMDQARVLLAGSDLPLSEVARRCGFCHENYFSNAFLREAGVRPGVYRKQRQLGSLIKM